jgi:hypothetical protein
MISPESRGNLVSKEHFGPNSPHQIDNPFMTQKWRDAIFINWPVPAAAVARVIPNGLEPDLFNGTAWVSLVPFRMENLRIRHLPPIPGTSNFGEVNVRTYVRGPNGPGVWFCSLDVHAALATLVARTFYRLPYYHGEVSETQAATTSNWKVRRKRPEVVAGELEIEKLSTPVNDLLSVFLTARWRLYSGRSKKLRVAQVDHPPWDLAEAKIKKCTTGLVDHAGFDVSEATPTAYWSPGVPVRVTAPKLTR